MRDNHVTESKPIKSNQINQIVRETITHAVNEAQARNE